jgi:hypothetical protein
MIKPNELRIGNWAYTNGRSQKILSIFEEGVNLVVDQSGHFPVNEFTKYDCIEPIILTPELIAGCGFRASTSLKETNYYNDDIHGSILFKDGEYWLIDYELNGWVRLQYLHELQNLYFSLTGAELEINFFELSRNT